jgi:pimeloyl-ACP methyl ester carboxylesterase
VPNVPGITHRLASSLAPSRGPRTYLIRLSPRHSHRRLVPPRGPNLNVRRSPTSADDYHCGWHRHLLQGLGNRPARRLQPWLALERTHGKTRCCSWPTRVIAVSLTTGGGMAVPASLGTATKMDTYADDLAALVLALNLKDAIHVGHSTGGEVARYIGRHGTARVAKAVLIGAVPPSCSRPRRIPAGCRSRCSTGFAPVCWPTARSSSRTLRSVLVEPIAPAQGIGGTQGLVLAAGNDGRLSRPRSTASRRSRRLTSPRIWRSSTCRLSSCMATTIRSCRSTPQPGSRSD